jgi:hypothetical protein
MKAKHQWNSAITSCLPDRAILRARLREVKTMRSKPPIPGLLPSEALSEGAMNTPPQICNVCKESRPLAITGRLAQSVSHDLRNHLSAIYSNVEFMSESRTTQAEREKLLQDVHAVIPGHDWHAGFSSTSCENRPTTASSLDVPEQNG